MPEELLNAEARQRLNNIFGGAEQNPVNTVPTTHATDAFRYATFAGGEPIPPAHETGAPILGDDGLDEMIAALDAPEPAAQVTPEPVLLAKLIEDCFSVKEPLRRYNGRGVEAYFDHNKWTTDHGIPEQRFPIPDADLKILEKIYHNKYEEAGRKHGAILRYIKFFRDQVPEPTDFFSKLKRQIERS